MPASYTWPLASVPPTPPVVPPTQGPPTISQTQIFSQELQLYPRSWQPPGFQAPQPTGLLAALFSTMANNLGFVGDMVLPQPPATLSALKADLRLETMSGSTMDIYAADFYGTGLPRYQGETDAHYENRIQGGLFIPRLTRPAFFSMLLQLTGVAPELIEGWRPSDVGGLSKTTGSPFLSGGKYLYHLATNMPASYVGENTGGAPLRLMNPGGRYGTNPGYAFQALIVTTWPLGFGAQGNEVVGMLTVTGSNPPTESGGTFTVGSPSVYTNLSGAALCKLSNGAIAVVGGKSVFASVVSGDPRSAIFNPAGLTQDQLSNGQSQVLRAIDRLRAEGVTIWAKCIPAETLAAQGWTS